MKPNALQVGLTIAIVIVLAAMAVGWRDCRRHGGTYVRGVFWMECVR